MPRCFISTNTECPCITDVWVIVFFPYINYKHDHRIHDIDIKFALMKILASINSFKEKCKK
jgi:hypothetical protein